MLLPDALAGKQPPMDGKVFHRAAAKIDVPAAGLPACLSPRPQSSPMKGPRPPPTKDSPSDEDGGGEGPRGSPIDVPGAADQLRGALLQAAGGADVVDAQEAAAGERQAPAALALQQPPHHRPPPPPQPAAGRSGAAQQAHCTALPTVRAQPPRFHNKRARRRAPDQGWWPQVPRPMGSRYANHARTGGGGTGKMT